METLKSGIGVSVAILCGFSENAHGIFIISSIRRGNWVAFYGVESGRVRVAFGLEIVKIFRLIDRAKCSVIVELYAVFLTKCAKFSPPSARFSS